MLDLESSAGTAATERAATEVTAEAASTKTSSSTEQAAAESTASCGSHAAAIDVFVPVQFFGEMTIGASVDVVMCTDA